jgi:putative restriction endonuclease
LISLPGLVGWVIQLFMRPPVIESALESSIRSKIFDFLLAATERYGEVLPWQILTKDFRFQGENIPLLGAKGIWKPRVFGRIPISIATAPPKNGQPAPYDDGMDASGRLAYRYRGTDPFHSDNVGLRLAMQHGVPLVYFFGIEKGLYLPTWPVFIVGDDPAGLTFCVAVDDQAWLRVDAGLMVAEGLQDARREYVTRVTLHRLHQQQFRTRVLRAYRSCCAICRLKHTELLDAAHIVPDSDPRGEAIVPNGLALCKIHHAAFDRNILGINPELRVEIRQDILEEVDGPMLKHGLQEMNQRQILLPRNELEKPRRDLIAVRYEEFRGVG